MRFRGKHTSGGSGVRVWNATTDWLAPMGDWLQNDRPLLERKKKQNRGRLSVNGHLRTFKEGRETPTALSDRRICESRLLAPSCDGNSITRRRRVPLPKID